MTVPQRATALGERAGKRPWRHVSTGFLYDADGLNRADVRGDRQDADAPFIVYAVNHIEQAEADLQEALALLEGVAYASAIMLGSVEFSSESERHLQDATQAALAFLARHAAQPVAT